MLAIPLFQLPVRRAFTLIEIIVTICVIAMLLCIVLPAVQMARESSRRVYCSSNLRQLGVALNHYVVSAGVYPRSNNGGGYSPHVSLLPYLDHANIYGATNFQVLSPPTPEPQNKTACAWQPNVLLCPSDGYGSSQWGRANFAGNRGFGFDDKGAMTNGLFTRPGKEPAISSADITDGTANTAAMIEWLTGPLAITVKDSRRSVFQTARRLAGSNDFEPFARMCRGLNTANATVNGLGKGNNWMHGDVRSTMYNHTLQPNGHSCTNDTLVQQGAWTAGSNHNAGVNVLFADGHCAYMRDSVSIVIWRGIGSRNGQEVIELDRE